MEFVLQGTRWWETSDELCFVSAIIGETLLCGRIGVAVTYATVPGAESECYPASTCHALIRADNADMVCVAHLAARIQHMLSERNWLGLQMPQLMRCTTLRFVTATDQSVRHPHSSYCNELI